MAYRRGSMSLSTLMTLAVWRLRQGWFLLLITGLGMVAGLVLVCAVPLFSDVATTAGLRDDLNASVGRADIVVHSSASVISAQAINAATQSIQKEVRQRLGSYVLAPQFSLQTQSFSIDAIGGVPRRPGDRLSFLGASLDQLTPHLHLLQGRMPRDSGSAIEMVITPETAKDLSLTVGSVLMIHVVFHSETQLPLSFAVSVRIVGIADPLSVSDAYWHGETLDISPLGNTINVYRGVAANETLLRLFSQMDGNASMLRDRTLETPADLLWYYRLDVSHISITNLNDINNAVALFQVDNYNNSLLNQHLFVENTLTYLPNNKDLLEKYQNQAAVVSVPVGAMLVLILGLVLFFVSIMTDLLVERQIDAIALLRSRGATRWQIIVAFLLQGVGLNLISIIVGPLLAIPAVFLLVHVTLAAADQGALNILSDDLLPWFLELGWLPFIVVIGSLLTMALALVRATSFDVLSLRRETTRTKRNSLLQRLGLDGIAALLAVIGYMFSTYILNAGVLDAHLRLLLLSPLTVFEIVFLALAMLLFLLRIFPFVLQRAAALAARSRGATLQLAMTHMARAPREPVRMTLLLALAIAFAIFTLVFTASQVQRQPDIASYQTGADFVGMLPAPGMIVTAAQVQQATQTYRHISGVTDAALGFTSTASGLNLNIALNAIDAATFAASAHWTEQNSAQPLSSLMAQLLKQRSHPTASIPAIVDASTWRMLNLAPGKHFTLVISPVSVPLDFVAISEVHFLPLFGGNATGGILIDYQTYSSILSGVGVIASSSFAANTVWLRTRDDSTSLQSVRNALSKGRFQLNNLQDRRAIIEQLSHDPLYLDQVGTVTLGAFTALLLAFVGNIAGSWFRVRVRQTNFAVLRALGATNQQIGSIHTWEQGVISITALVLGVLLGALFAAWIVPLFVFTTASAQGMSGDITSEAFYARQSTPPIQIIIPPSLLLLLGVLLFLCLLSLFTMMRVSTASSMSQKLRLNED